MALDNKKHYKDFMSSEEGISSNILANRLKKLEEMGFITKIEDPLNGSRVIYQLTTKAWSMSPIFLEVANWSSQQIQDTRVIEVDAISMDK